MHAVDRTLSIGDRATELMRAYSFSATPTCYELWYTYVTGLKPELNEAVKALVGSGERLSPGQIDELHGRHLGGDRLSAETNRASTSLLVEIDQVLSLIDAAAGSTAEYGASLAVLNGDLSDERRRVRDVIETLVSATREVAASNARLEARLRESRIEIENLHAALDTVRAETLVDPLTGIANRKHFDSVLGTGVARAHGTGGRLVLVVIDIDRFKRFNDTYGHATGDQVLRLVSAAMRENVEPGATIARFGGEEFAILLPDTGRDVAAACAEKIRRNVMSRELLKRSTGESLGRVTVSLGIADLRPGDSPSSFMGRADECMYRAKRTGRNRTVGDWEGGDTAGAVAA